MKLSIKEIERIDKQQELLAASKFQRHLDDVIDGKEKPSYAPISSFNFYRSFIPLPDQNDDLEVGMIHSFNQPTGEDFIDLTPIDEIKNSADLYKGMRGVDVADEAFHSYQNCRSNPSLVHFETISFKQMQEIVKEMKS